MAQVIHIRKLANPRKRKAKRRNSRTRRMTPKQIKYFGSARQRAALKAKRNSRRRRTAAVRTVRKPRRRANRRRTAVRRRPNTALLVTLGPTVNPHRKRRKKNVAHTTHPRNRRRNTATHHRRRRVRAAANPVRRRRYNRRRRNTSVRRRRRNSPRVVYMTRRNRRRHNRRRNPTVLGVNLTSKAGLKLVGGVMLGVSATKFLPTVLPASIFSTLGSSSVATTVISGFSAFISGWLASRFDADLGAGMYLGGFAQTLSVALNAWLPSVYSAIGSPLSGLGDFAPGRFAVPQNPLRQISAPPTTPAPAGSVSVNSGLGRAYWPAY